MAFVPARSLPGLVFVPEPRPCGAGQESCPDCFSCQGCAPSRCALCRAERGRGCGRLGPPAGVAPAAPESDGAGKGP
ncbi:MAG: hypothetical protein AB1634_09530 [Thermodesulfobacteriota bacterium]